VGADGPVRSRWRRPALPLAALALAGSCGAGSADGSAPQAQFVAIVPPQARSVAADSLEVDPAGVGMDPSLLARLDSVVLAAIDERVTPGAALAIGRHGRLVRLRGYGLLGDGTDTPVTPTTLYDLASLTKVVGTTTAVAMLEEEGRIALDRPVVSYLPWWSGGLPDKERVTVRQLLLHRAGLPEFRAWFTEISGEEAYRQALAAEPLEWPPGSRTVYSDLGAMTLGFLVSEVSGLPLDRFLRERLWEPLGMEDTVFRPDASLRPRTAPTELDTIWRGFHVHGVVHDENAYAMGGVAGHAGLFSTALDLSIFARMMVGGGAVPTCSPTVLEAFPCARGASGPVRIFAPETVERYTRRNDPASSRALGWDTPSGRSSAGDYFGERAFGHTGFTGTSIWIDSELDLFVVLLTNRVNPSRSNQRHVPFRRTVHDLAAMAIVDQPVRPREGAGR